MTGFSKTTDTKSEMKLNWILFFFILLVVADVTTAKGKSSGGGKVGSF